MDREKAPCPNCGHRMVTERMDRQWAGEREIELQWVVCLHCRHVRLERWAYLDMSAPGRGRQSSRPPPRPDHP